MKKRGPLGNARDKKPRIGLVFCEDDNDADSLKSLARAIWPDVPRIEYCRKPLILLRDLEEAKARKRIDEMLAILKAKSAISTITFVIAHQDCDAIEPAHEALAQKILTKLNVSGIPNTIAVTPAWEIEAWWYLWPDAVAGVNGKWKRLTRKGNHGMLTNAKEQLRRDLRVKGVRDYEESDSRRIARNVANLGILNNRQGTSNSFSAFQEGVLKVKATLT